MFILDWIETLNYDVATQYGNNNKHQGTEKPLTKVPYSDSMMLAKAHVTCSRPSFGQLALLSDSPCD